MTVDDFDPGPVSGLDLGEWPALPHDAVTMLQASHQFALPLREVRAVYIWGGLGRRDRWDCWFASASDLRFALGLGAPPLVPVTAAAPVQRAASTVEALRAKLKASARTAPGQSKAGR
jgi:hypothetical protein